MTKRTNYEFLIVLLGGIMANLAKLEKEEPEPEFIETIEISYSTPIYTRDGPDTDPLPAPPLPFPDRRVLPVLKPIYADDSDYALIPGVSF